MAVDTTRNYNLATDDEEYYPVDDSGMEPEIEEDEDEDYHEEEDRKRITTTSPRLTVAMTGSLTQRRTDA
jgi:hypothetical protein